jgi:chromosome segregation ATPase
VARAALAPAAPAPAAPAAPAANLSNTNTLETNTEESLAQELENVRENIPRVTALNELIEENLAALQIELRSIDERITDLNVRNEEAKRIPEEGARNYAIGELEQERVILMGEKGRLVENINGEGAKLRTLAIRTRIYQDRDVYIQLQISTLTNNAQIAEHQAQIAEYQTEIDSESKKLRGRNAQFNATIRERIREVRAEIMRIRAIIRDLTIQQERINLEAGRLRTRINAYTQLMKDEEEDAQKNLLDGWEYAGRDDEYNALQWIFTDGTITSAKPVRQVAQAPARPAPVQQAPARPAARPKVRSPYEQRGWRKGGAITHKKGNKTRISKNKTKYKRRS